jgi:hypothetical protein
MSSTRYCSTVVVYTVFIYSRYSVRTVLDLYAVYISLYVHSTVSRLYIHICTFTLYIGVYICMYDYRY